MSKQAWVLTVSGVAVAALWVANPFLLAWVYPESLEPRGQFGDQFGATNALFSGVALLGVALAIWLQVRELDNQRRDIKHQQEQLAQSVDAQRRAEEALHKRLELEESLAERRSTLDLFDDWQSPDTVQARAEAQVFLRSLLGMGGSIPGLSEFEEKLGAGSPFIWEVGRARRTVRPQDIRGVLEVVRFFRKWAGLVSAGQVDTELAKVLLAEDAREWNNLLFTNLDLPEPGDPNRDRLMQIRQKVMNPMIFGN